MIKVLFMCFVVICGELDWIDRCIARISAYVSLIIRDGEKNQFLNAAQWYGTILHSFETNKNGLFFMN